MIPTAHISHTIAGRMRLRIPTKRRDADFFAELARTFSTLEGVAWVKPNFLTGSVLVVHKPELTMDQIQRFAQERELFEIASQPSRPAIELGPLIAVSRHWLAQRFGQAEKPTAETRGGIVLALLILGLIQLSRGQILAPATTLFWYALEMFTAVPPKSPSESE